MNELIDRKNKIIMGWSPKAGSAVACKMFFEHMGLLQEALEYHPWVHIYRQEIFYPKFGYASKQELNDPSYLKFKVVRNPYTRIVSIYLQMQVLKKSNKSFVEFLTKKHEDIFTANHLRLQKFNYENKENFYLIKLENFKDGIDRLNSKFDTNFNPRHTYIHHAIQDKSSHSFVGRTKYPEFENIDEDLMKKEEPFITFPSYENFYDEEIKDMVYKMYKEDIDFYKYDFPW